MEASLGCCCMLNIGRGSEVTGQPVNLETLGVCYPKSSGGGD
jgi:hypothetical protein